MKTLYTLRAHNLYIALDLWSNKVSNAIAKSDRTQRFKSIPSLSFVGITNGLYYTGLGPRIMGQEVVETVLKEGRQWYNWQNQPFIPVEFSVAAYPFGHRQVRHQHWVHIQENLVLSIP
ncbi:hypothetical protein [Moorena producens]|uniref:hypothetical protein n=1 Tax=Moorena producens TaxID=1155739 RepID=UPI003C77370B